MYPLVDTCIHSFAVSSVHTVKVKGGILPSQGQGNYISWPMWAGLFRGYRLAGHQGLPRCNGNWSRIRPDRASKEPLTAVGAHVWPSYGIVEYPTANGEVLVGY